MKSTFSTLSILLIFYDCTMALIVPTDLTQLLYNAVYASLPPIKKGTDSRLGIGFNLGPHADFQILVELGPQKKTDPIGNVDSKRRRMATYNAAMRGELGPLAQFVAKYQMQRNIRKEFDSMVKLESDENIDDKKVSE